MTQFYFEPEREDDETALPDAEVFYAEEGTLNEHFEADGHRTTENCDACTGSGCSAVRTPSPKGWYWWACSPGCLPDGEPNGPFETEEEAVADARDF